MDTVKPRIHISIENIPDYKTRNWFFSCPTWFHPIKCDVINVTTPTIGYFRVYVQFVVDKLLCQHSGKIQDITVCGRLLLFLWLHSQDVVMRVLNQEETTERIKAQEQEKLQNKDQFLDEKAKLIMLFEEIKFTSQRHLAKY